MDNSETQETLGAKHRTQTNKTQKSTTKHTTQKTKNMSTRSNRTLQNLENNILSLGILSITLKVQFPEQQTTQHSLVLHTMPFAKYLKRTYKIFFTPQIALSTKRYVAAAAKRFREFVISISRTIVG